MIHHVALECRRSDEPAHRRFWPALGFRAVDPPASLRSRAAWFERDGTQVHLLWTDDPAVPPRGHVAVRVDDLDALAASAIELTERERHWGERRCFARAPGGHVVEVFEVSPGGPAR